MFSKNLFRQILQDRSALEKLKCESEKEKSHCAVKHFLSWYMFERSVLIST